MGAHVGVSVLLGVSALLGVSVLLGVCMSTRCWMRMSTCRVRVMCRLDSQLWTSHRMHVQSPQTLPAFHPGETLKTWGEKE